MNKTLAKIICRVRGHIYPAKKMPLPDYVEKYMEEGEGVFMADTSKPCARCKSKESMI